MKYIQIIFILFVLVALFSCSQKTEKGKKEKPPASVDIMVAADEEFENTIEMNGTALSNEMVELHPDISGRLT
jgi:membrane fusion protein, multidrug efflux system